MFPRRHVRRFDRFILIGAVLLSFLAAILPAAAPVSAAPYPPRVWLPIVSKVKPPPPPPAPPPTGCVPNAQEAAVANYLRSDPGQQRGSLTCNPILARVARERAADMARRNYFDHVNPDGYAANWLVQQAGYRLPDFYDQGPTGNNIEAIAAGQGSAADVWNAWMGSPDHRRQLLGLEPFFADQIDYGIGYAYGAGSDFGHYWVVITARH